MEKRDYKKICSEFSKNPVRFIEKCEKKYDDFIIKCADRVEKENIKRIYICGQSGSGKTTTSMRIAQTLKERGNKAHIIELDDFFHVRGKHRINSKGVEDFESIFALDLKEIYKLTDRINKKKPVSLPEFDFKTGNRTSNEEIIIEKDDILIIEGIHSFNKRIQKSFKEGINIFVTVNSGVFLGDSCLSNYDLRFARRLIRDYYYRNANPDWTIELWQMVRLGEKRYAKGYMEKADILFNTFLDYEIFLFRDDFVKLSRIGIKTAESKGYYKVLLNKYKKIDVPFTADVPKNSILNEFIPKK